MDFDVVVIGAGVVGLASAAALAERQYSVLVLEREIGPGRGISARNSEVVHAGIYYPEGSLKAQFCVAGSRRLTKLGTDGVIPFRKTGKLIVATVDSEIPYLEKLLALGNANGVEGLRLIDGCEAKKLEPNVRAVAAIESPNTGVTDVSSYVLYLAFRGRDAGAVAVVASPVTAAEAVSGGYRVITADDSEVTARVVINAAGLEADRIAALPGLDIEAAGYAQEWVKGNYAAVSPAAAKQVRRLIYPAPEHTGVTDKAGGTSFSGLGVHLTLTIDGRARLGPDVEFLDARVEEYRPRTGTSTAFFESARRYLPFLEPDDVVADTSGIRPKLLRSRSGFADFVIAEESERGLPGWINLVGIESPGMTSSLPIADEVTRLAEQTLL